MGNSCSPGEVFDSVFFMLSFFPRDVLDEIWDLIESISEGFPTYSYHVFCLKDTLTIEWQEQIT